MMKKVLTNILAAVLFILAGCDTGDLQVGVGGKMPGKSTDQQSTGTDPGLSQTIPLTQTIPLQGQVLNIDGSPAAGVTVKAYLATVAPLSQTIPLQPGAGSYRMQSEEVETEVVTDASGSFAFKNPPVGKVNLEAVKSDDLKVFKAEVEVAKDRGLHLGQLKLNKTGTITGRVLASDSAVSNLEGVDVYIPGSSYLARTDASGHYTLANVAAGSFRLVATKLGLGRASANGIAVEPKTSTMAPDLVLEVPVPSIASVAPVNAAVAATVTLSGENFGASTGETLQVFVGGALASSVTRVDDNTIRVSVPPGATTGDIVVTVGGATSNGLPFTVLKSIGASPADIELLLGRSQGYTATATDSEGVFVPSPFLKWEVSSGSSIKFVTSGTNATNSVRVETVSTGDSQIRLSSGAVSLYRKVHVFKVNGVSLNKTSLNLNAMPDSGDPGPGYAVTDTLVATVQASDGTSRKVTWSTSDPARVTVSSTGVVQTVRGAPAGQAVITATSVDDTSIKAIATVSISIKSGINVGIE